MHCIRSLQTNNQKWGQLHHSQKLPSTRAQHSTVLSQQQADPASSQPAEIQVQVPPQPVEKLHINLKSFLLPISLVQEHLWLDFSLCESLRGRNNLAFKCGLSKPINCEKLSQSYYPRSWCWVQTFLPPVPKWKAKGWLKYTSMDHIQTSV